MIGGPPRAWALGLAVAVLGGCAEHGVLRSAGGEISVGRFIAPRAYEAYARGTLFEADGKLERAAEAYAAAASLDPEGPEGWTRLGAVLCKLERHDAAGAAFAHAGAVGPSFGPLHTERARCALARGDAETALAAAETALLLDPHNEDVALLRAESFAAAGDRPAAVRELVARVAIGGASQRATDRLAELARAAGDAGALRIAEQARRSTTGSATADRRGPRAAKASGAAPDAGTGHGRAAVARVDAALLAGDLTAARRLATRAGLGPGDLALRAALLGRASLAAEQADLVAAADPRDGSGAVARLVALDLALDDDALARAVKPLAARASSDLARLAIAEVLARRVGPDAARAALGDTDLAARRDDALEERVRARLAAHLER